MKTGAPCHPPPARSAECSRSVTRYGWSDRLLGRRQRGFCKDLASAERFGFLLCSGICMPQEHDYERHTSTVRGPYVEGPEPREAEIRQMTKLARGSEGSWVKLRDGSWGVKMTSAAGPNDRVTVRKKSGQTSDVTLGRLVWTDRQSAWLFTVGSAGAASSSGGSAPSRKRPYECEECGERVNPGSSCWETGMLH